MCVLILLLSQGRVMCVSYYTHRSSTDTKSTLLVRRGQNYFGDENNRGQKFRDETSSHQGERNSNPVWKQNKMKVFLFKNRYVNSPAGAKSCQLIWQMLHRCFGKTRPMAWELNWALLFLLLLSDNMKLPIDICANVVTEVYVVCL